MARRKELRKRWNAEAKVREGVEEREGVSLSRDEKKKIFLGEKKVLFFLSLCLSLPSDRFQSISLELMAFQGIHQEEWKRERERRERERDAFGKREKKILIPTKKA